MEVEDEVMQSIESRDKIISRQLEVIAQDKKELAQGKEELAQSKKELALTKEELAQKKQTLSLAVQTLLELGMSNDVIAEKLSISKDIVEEIRRN